jgi:hypothetical protein
VTGTILSQKTIGHTDYIIREVVVQPGGSTGWHYHHGNLYAFEKSGTLTHSHARPGAIRTSCSVVSAPPFDVQRERSHPASTSTPTPGTLDL